MSLAAAWLTASYGRAFRVQAFDGMDDFETPLSGGGALHTWPEARGDRDTVLVQASDSRSIH